MMEPREDANEPVNLRDLVISGEVDILGTSDDSQELPPFTSTTYDDLPYEEAQQLYERYKNDPQTNRRFSDGIIPFTAPTYKGSVVLAPQPGGRGVYSEREGRGSHSEPANATTNRGQVAWEGIPREVARNVGSTALSIGDSIANYVTGREGEDRFNNAPAWEDRFARVNPGDSTLDSLTVEGGAMAIGGGAGFAAAAKLMKNTPKFLQNIAKYFATEGGATSALDAETQTVFTGPDSAFKDLTGIGVFGDLTGVAVSEEENEESLRILQQRMNLLIDGAVLGGVISGAGNVTVAGTKLVHSFFTRPAVGLLSKGAREEELVRDVLRKLSSVNSIGSDQNVVKELADIFSNPENQRLTLSLIDGTEKILPLDTLTALERATASRDSQTVRLIIQQARELRKGQGGVQTTDRVSGPARALADTTQQTEEMLGGSPAIEEARRGVVESGTADVNRAQLNATTKRNTLEQAERDAVAIVQNDPLIADQLSTKAGFDIFQAKDQSQDQIVIGLRKAYENMRTEKNAKYAAVVGGSVDIPSMVGIIQRLSPEQLDLAYRSLPRANSQFQDLLGQVKPRVNDAGIPETSEDIINRVSQWANSKGLDFQRLFTEIRPHVSETAENLFAGSGAERAAGNSLREFVRWIDNDALEHVARSGDGATADAAREAVRYYKEEFAPLWRQGALERFSDTFESTIGRTSPTDLQAGRLFKGTQFEQESLNLVSTNMSGQNRKYAGQIISALKRSDSGTSEQIVADYMVADLVGKLKLQLADTPLSELNPSAIITGVQDYASIIRENFPSEGKRLTSLIDSLIAARSDIVKLQKAVDIAEETATAVRDKVYGRELSAFFKDATGEAVNPNGFAVFEGILKNRQSADVIEDLMSRAQGNPIIEQGMKVAYARFIRNNFLSATTEIGGNRAVRVGSTVKELDDGITEYLEYGDKIFGEGNPIMQTTRDLVELSGLTQASKAAKSVASDSSTRFTSDAKDASNRLIMQTLGPLNRIGARIRSGVTGLIDRISPNEAAAKVLDQLWADPEYAGKMFQKISQKDQPFLDPETRQIVFQFALRAGIYRSEDEAEFHEVLSTDIELQRAIMQDYVVESDDPEEMDELMRLLDAQSRPPPNAPVDDEMHGLGLR